MQPLMRATRNKTTFCVFKAVDSRTPPCLPHNLQLEENNLPGFQVKQLIILAFVTQLEVKGHFPFCLGLTC